MSLTGVVPLPYRILALILVAAAFGGYCWVQGADHVQNKWDATTLKQTLIVTRIQQRRAEATIQVVTQYVDRIKTVREKGAEIIKEVPVYVPNDACALPGGFRVLHDAAALGVIPDPSGIANAAAVPAQDAAETIAANYQQYHECTERLMALQDWIRKQSEAK